MATAQQFRTNELKVQEKLYENVYLLTMFYPPNEDFKAHFKRDMFMNKNKAGFYQVVYYLLSTLNPELTKQKLTSWPPYDIRHENKFRTELIHYITELNTLYEDADIPVLMTSHLITPGGMKCLRFLLKLSMLVMFEHLKKMPDVGHLLVGSLKNTKSKEMTDAYIDKVKTLTHTIDEESRKIHDDFQKSFVKMKEKAEELVEKRSKINADLAIVSQDHKRIQEKCNISPDTSPLIDTDKKVNKLREEVAKISEVRRQLETLEDLMTYIMEEKNIIAIDNDSLNFPEDIDCILSTNSENIDLLQFLNALNIFLEKLSLHIPQLPSGYLMEVREKVNEVNESCSNTNKRIDKLHEEVNRISERPPQMSIDNQNPPQLSIVDNQDQPQIANNQDYPQIEFK